MDLNEILKKTTYTGLGLISMGKDAIEKAAQKIKEDLKLSEEEGKKVYDELSVKADEAKKELQDCVDKAVDKTLSKLNLVKKEEIDALNKKID
jgi:polyhydroxyalkanoate synthesis regulator phasin